MVAVWDFARVATTEDDLLPLSRDRLVADWRCRLTAAEQPLSDATHRPAWFVRVQLRLYRFLLSLYGDGDWRTTDSIVSQQVEVVAGEESVVFDAPDVLPLAGKPAKELGKIREVLKAVATAQDQPLSAGPLVAGLPPEHWVVVAVVKCAVDPVRCVELLHSQQFKVRLAHRGTGIAVEVPAVDHPAALKLLLHEERRSSFLRNGSSRPMSAGALWMLFIVMFAPIPAFAALLVANARYPDALVGEHAGEAALYALALFAAFFSIACVRPISRLVLAADRFVMHWSGTLKKRFFSKH